MLRFCKPDRLIAGDTWEFAGEFDYLPAAGWIAVLGLMNANFGTTFNATPDGDGYKWLVNAAVSAEVPAGLYDYVVWVERVELSTRYQHTLLDSKLKVEGNPAITGPQDRRSRAERILDAIEAQLEGRAVAGDVDVINIAFDAYQVTREAGGIIKLRALLKAEVAQEAQLKAIASGNARPTNLAVRFRRS